MAYRAPRYTKTNVSRRIQRLREIEARDKDRFKASPLGSGFLTRRERYQEAYRDLGRRYSLACNYW
jgi:hypothetical protein